MASGLPVVTTRLDGLYKTFGDSSGLTWSVGSEGLIAEAIALAENKTQLIENARLQLETVSATFGIEPAVDSFESVIRAVSK
jgi:glycosyltransferase involved in cell wall biosynthesis